MKRVKIGVIGLGRMGRKHLRELVNCDFWDVNYVCDINQEKEKYHLRSAAVLLLQL